MAHGYVLASPKRCSKTSSINTINRIGAYFMHIDQQDRSSMAPVEYAYSETDVDAPWYRDSLLLVTLSGVLLIDQLAKWLIRANLDLYELWPAQGAFRLTHTENSGAAFSLFPNFLPGIVFISIIAIGLYVYVYHVQARARRLDRLAAALAMGGALGNLVDRVAHGTVVDFVSISLFPIFNIADVAIILGIGLMVMSMLSEDNKPDSVPAASKTRAVIR